MKKTWIIITFMVSLIASPLVAEPAGTEREKKIDAMVDFFDKFDLIGLVRFRPEYKDNFDFDKNGSNCVTTPANPATIPPTPKSVVCTNNNDNKEFVGQKIQIGFNFKGKSIKAKVVLQDARVWGGEAGSASGLNTANSNTNQSTDIREAWIEFGLTDQLGLQTGRQKLVYGDQRLVGGLDWTNVGRSFDGLRFKYKSDIFDSHLFGMVISEADSDTVGNNVSTTKDAYLTGFYNTIKFKDHLHTDLYYFGVHKQWEQSTDPQYLYTAGRTPIQEISTTDKSRDRDNMHTVGIRFTNKTKKVKGKKKSPTALDWTLEASHQFGETGRKVAAQWDTADVVHPLNDPTIFNATANPCRVYGTSKVTGNSGCRLYLEKEVYDAFSGSATAGYTLKIKEDHTFRLGAQYAIGSGDPDRTDASVATFHNLFPTNHLYYGQADQVSLQNMEGKSVNASLKMGKYGTIVIAYWEVDKHKLQDAWYGVGGGGVNGGTKATTESIANSKYQSTYNADGTLNSLAVAHLRKHLFKEYDITYKVKIGEVNFNMGYSLVVAGDAAQASKTDRIVLSETFAQDLADGVINDPATLLKFNRPSFDRNAHYAYLQMQYKF